MGQLFDLGEIPSSLSFVCAAMTVVIPLFFNWLVKTAKRNGNPPWREEEE